MGSFCVMDDEPREGVSLNEIAFMKDMATTVLVHLEMVRAREENKRHELLVRGLGSFVEGENSVAGFRRSSGDVASDEVETSRRAPWYERQYAMQRVHTPKSSSAGSTVSGASPLPSSSPKDVAPVPPRQQSDITSSKHTRQTSNTGLFGDAVARAQSQSAIVAEETSGQSKALPKVSSISRTLNKQHKQRSLDVSHTFARAANIVRECVGVVSTTDVHLLRDSDTDVSIKGRRGDIRRIVSYLWRYGGDRFRSGRAY